MAKYDVQSQTVEVLFAPGTAMFQVPPFQRPFAWGKEEITQLVDDIFGSTDSADLPYFLGSVVLAKQEEHSGPDERDLILDGQQRLTTLSLIIACLRDKLTRAGDQDASEFNTYLFSRRIRDKRTAKLRLQHTDAAVYESLLENPNQLEGTNGRGTRLHTAVANITEQIDEHARGNPRFSQSDSPYQDMLDRVLYEVELVRITAPSEGDAFRLFETLNDRGLALSAADLVKNKLFSRCGSDLADAVESWTNLVALTKNEDVVAFLRTYWLAFHGFVRKNRLYDAFRDYIATLTPKDAALLVLDLEEEAKKYEEIVAPVPQRCRWGDDVGSILEHLIAFRARSCRPVLLAVARHLPSDMLRAVRICAAITVRYSIVGEKNPNLLERLYHQIANAVRKPHFQWSDLAGIRDLDEVPDDFDFVARLSNVELPTVTLPWREMLIRINEHLGRGEIRLDRPSRVNVEHILPQNPSAVALAEARLTPDEAAKLAVRLGNLTLLSGTRNRSISNRRFSERRAAYANSDVFMTRELAKFEEWTREQIEWRTQQMAQAAAAIYPHPISLAT